MLGEREGAEDVVQETFLSAFRHLGDFEGRSRFSTWITMNRCRNVRRAAAHARTTALAIDPPGDLPEQIDRAIDRAARGQPSRPRSRMLRHAMAAVFVGVIVAGIIRVVHEATRPFPAGDARIAGEVSRPKREAKDRFRRNEASSLEVAKQKSQRSITDVDSRQAPEEEATFQGRALSEENVTAAGKMRAAGQVSPAPPVRSSSRSVAMRPG